MSPSEEFFDLLDESPRDSRSLIVQTPDGETRSFPIATAAKAYEVRARGGKGTRRPRLQRARNRFALLLALLEKEEHP